MMEYPLFPVGDGPTVRVDVDAYLSACLHARASPISLRLHVERTHVRARARLRRDVLRADCSLRVNSVGGS
jgi:hypothetical protein